MDSSADMETLSSKTQSMEFMDLNDDCIFAVLERLSPNEFCSMSFTCKKLKQMTEEVFQRKYSKKSIIIRAEESSVKFSHQNPKYLKYFSKFIKYVRISGRIKPKHLFDFLELNCNSELESLTLISFWYNETEHSIAEWSNELNNLVKKYCETLKCFRIYSERRYDDGWLHFDFPKLKTLSFHDAHNDPTPEILNQFFQRNTGINTILCTTPIVLRAVLNNVKQIERLVYAPRSEDIDESLINDLKTYSKQYPIKWFEYEYNGRSGNLNNLNLLADLNKIQPVHAWKGCMSGEMNLSQFGCLEHLVKLNVFVKLRIMIIPEHLDMLSTAIPDLEELNLEWRSDCLFKDIAMPFVKNSKKLKKFKLTLGRRTCITNSNDLVELNAVRKAIVNATRIRGTLVIPASDDEMPTFMDSSNGLVNFVMRKNKCRY